MGQKFASEVTRARTLAPLAAMLCAWAAFFHRAVFEGEVFFARDAARLHEPLKAWAGSRLRRGELPLWFPDEGLGRPFVDMTVTGLFHPFTLAFVVFDGPTALSVCTLACYPVALVGFWLLAQRWGPGPWVSALGALCFAHCGYLVSMSDNLTFLFSMCALPWLLFALDRALVSGRASAWVGAATVEGLVVLNGDLQSAYWFGLVALAYAATLPRGAAAAPEHGVRLRATATTAAALIGAAVLAAVQVLPSWSLFQESDRANASAFYSDAVSWPLHPLRVLSAVDHPATLDGDDSLLSSALFAGPGRGFWARSIYLGPGVMALALAGSGLERRRLRYFLAGLGLVSLWLALGEFGGLYPLAFKLVPLWSAFRYPEKLVGLASFATVALATLSLEQLARRQVGARWPWKPAAAMGGILAALLVLFGPLQSSTARAQPAWSRLTALWFDGAWPALLALSLAAAVGWLWVRGKLAPPIAFAAATALLFGDLARANLAAYRTTDRLLYDYEPPWVAGLRQREPAGPGSFRTHTALGGITALPLEALRALGVPRQAGDVVAMKNAFEPLFNAHYGIEAATTYLPGASPRLYPLFKQALRPTVLAAFNVKYAVSLASLHLEQTLAPAPAVVDVVVPFDLALLELQTPLPRARLVERWEAAGPWEEELQRLTDPSFQWATTALVEGATPRPDALAAHGSVRLASYAPERVALEVQVDHPALVVLSDAWASGWKATLDGQTELPVWKTNGVVRGVEVPAGHHTLLFTYLPSPVRVGGAISLAAALVALGVLFAPLFKRRVQADAR